MLLTELGRCLGLLDRQLGALDQNHVAQRPHRWDLARGPEAVKQAIQSTQQTDRQDLLLYFLSLYESIAPRLQGLKQSVIHNDANNYNIIIAVDPVDETASIGLIDFGDLLYSRTINDLAICSAYLMLDKSNPIEALAAVTSGYHQSYRLGDAELSCLFPLACLRLAQSVSISIEQQRQDPENEYLAISEKPAWTALKQLSAIKPDEVRERLWDACHQQATRQVGQVAWTAEEIIEARNRYVAPSSACLTINRSRL